MKPDRFHVTDLRDRLRAPSPRAMRSAGQLAIALTVAMLGFLLAIQLRAQQGLADRLAIERESDLGQILGELQSRSDQLLEDIVDVQVRLALSSGSAAREEALIDDAEAQLEALQILIGIVPVRGPGIVMTITDPGRTVGPDVILDAIQELRDAGAEAIEAGGVRVVAQTAVTGTEGSIQIGGRAVAFPLTIKAIGQPATLAEAMRIPGGVQDSINAHAGAGVRISNRGSISILSVASRPSFEHGRPR